MHEREARRRGRTPWRPAVFRFGDENDRCRHGNGHIICGPRDACGNPRSSRSSSRHRLAACLWGAAILAVTSATPSACPATQARCRLSATGSADPRRLRSSATARTNARAASRSRPTATFSKAGGAAPSCGPATARAACSSIGSPGRSSRRCRRTRSLSTRRDRAIRLWIDQGARATPTSAPAPPPWEAPLALDRPALLRRSRWRDLDVDRSIASSPPISPSRKRRNRSLVSDAVFARRVYLDVWGLLPTPEELQPFLADRSPAKRDALVATLLADNQKYAEHWISFWNDLLRNEDGVTYFSETAGRKSITDWLFASLVSNLPYDQFVASCSTRQQPTDPDGFLVGVNWRGETSAAVTPWMQASQNTAQIFLGVNLKCNACHDSFVSKWKLKDAYALAAYFSAEPQAAAVPLRRRAGRLRRARLPLSRADPRAAVELARRSARDGGGDLHRSAQRPPPPHASSIASGSACSATASSRTPTRWTASRGVRRCSTGSPAISSRTATT